jgi:hypothetical protein
MTDKTRGVTDAADAVVLLGLLLLAAAIYWWWGFAAVLAYVGTVLVIFGVALAMQRGRKAQQ